MHVDKWRIVDASACYPAMKYSRMEDSTVTTACSREPTAQTVATYKSSIERR